MNMNDKEWNEIWDDEADDDDDFNDIGSDIDANNDETFDNAAEWNEDEHEELIARDSILSHTIRTNQSLSGWSPFGGKDLFTNPDSSSPSQLSPGGPKILMNSNLPHSLTIEQQQLLSQQHIFQQHQLQQMAILKQQQIQLEQRLATHNRRCFTVEELERQMLASRSNPVSTDSKRDFPSSPLVENSKPVKSDFERHMSQQHQLQQMAILKQQQMQQEQKPAPQNRQYLTVEELERQMLANRSNPVSNDTQRDFPSPLIENSKPIKLDFGQQEKRNNTHERREGERHDRYHREAREGRDHRDRREQRDRRDHRDSRMVDKQKFKIIPPQVQLSVIDKAKLAHSLTTMHQDEFLQDRMPSSKEGFLFKRHSEASNDRTKHDGVLTEKERNWLTKIQEKIQADYDDNLDQDYYYLLYFNRFSMADEAAQRPCGPGVMDRRFIPRERLLYSNTSS